MLNCFYQKNEKKVCKHLCFFVASLCLPSGFFAAACPLGGFAEELLRGGEGRTTPLASLQNATIRLNDFFSVLFKGAVLVNLLFFFAV